MSRILLIGKTGQLGWELSHTLITAGELTAVQRPEIDLESPDSLVKIIRQIMPNYIVNAAAYTGVDLAETEVELARKINGTAPGVLAEEAKKINAILIHYSTDYVFDGSKGSPYTEEDVTKPLNIYGTTKLEGEQAVQTSGAASLVFRTSWVYSLRSNDGFVNKVLQRSRQQTELRMVTDQIGNPTWARMLAEVTAQIVNKGDHYLRERAGLYHLAGRGFASRFEWAELILALDPNKEDQITKRLQPAKTEDFPTPAERPLFSALDCTLFETTFDLELQTWQSALKQALVEQTNHESAK